MEGSNRECVVYKPTRPIGLTINQCFRIAEDRNMNLPGPAGVGRSAGPAVEPSSRISMMQSNSSGRAPTVAPRLTSIILGTSLASSFMSTRLRIPASGSSRSNGSSSKSEPRPCPPAAIRDAAASRIASLAAERSSSDIERKVS